jgi:hypothetical protein
VPGESTTRSSGRTGATDPTPRLIAFLEQRLQAELHDALSRSEDAHARYVRQSLGILEAIRADLAADPRRTPPEALRFLGRWALGYDTDPGFDPSWLLLT